MPIKSLAAAAVCFGIKGEELVVRVNNNSLYGRTKKEESTTHRNVNISQRRSRGKAKILQFTTLNIHKV